MDGELLSATFVELTDTMVADFDVIDFLHVLTDRSVQLLDVSAAGLLLADPRGELRLVAASSEAARLLELFQLQNDEGPCLECFRSGRPVTATDLNTETQHWPRFAGAAQEAGFASVQALPMRLREQVLGALNLFRTSPGPFDPAGVRIGQAMADVATISLLHERNMRHSDTLNEQLQTALNSRVIIEQAKGKLAERLGLDMDQAFSLLRDHADPVTGACPTWPRPSSTGQNQSSPGRRPGGSRDAQLEFPATPAASPARARGPGGSRGSAVHRQETSPTASSRPCCTAGLAKRQCNATAALVMAAHPHHTEANPEMVSRAMTMTANRLTMPKIATSR